MLGAALRRAQWRFVARAAAGKECGFPVGEQQNAGLGLVFSRYRHAAAAAATNDDGSIDRHFIEHELAYPLTAPKSNKDLRSAGVSWIWNKAGGDRAKIVEAVKAWTEEGNAVTRELINSLLVKLCARMEFLTGYQLLYWVSKTQPYELDDSDTLLFLHFSSLHKRKDKSRAAFKQLNEKNEHAYTCLLRSSSNTNHIESAEPLFKQMKDEGLLTSAEPYNIMMGLYLRLDDVEKAKEVLNELEASEIGPNLQTYKTLLGYKGQLKLEGLESKVRTFLDTLGSAKIKGEDWKTAIILYASMGRSDDVQRLWKDMASGGYVPDHYYLNAAEAFGRIGDMKKFEELCTQVAARNGTLTEDQCYRMVKVYSERGQMEKAEALLEKMVEAGYSVGFRVYHFLVEGYMKKGQHKKALEKFGECLRKGDDRGFKTPTLLTVLLAMEGYAKTKDVKGAEKLMKLMRETSSRRDTRLYNALIKVYIASGAEMFDVENRLKDCGVARNDETNKLLKELKLSNKCSA